MMKTQPTEKLDFVTSEWTIEGWTHPYGSISSSYSLQSSCRPNQRSNSLLL